MRRPCGRPFPTKYPWVCSSNLAVVLVKEWKGSATAELADEMEDLSPQYGNVTYIGWSSYGVLYSSTESKGRKVAIKKLSQVPTNIFCIRALYEIKILTRFHHENIIEIFDIFQRQSSIGVDTYVVHSLMESDLETVLKSLCLNQDQICYLVYQILCGLKYIHSANVLHRNLKPGNLLVNTACELKICEFCKARVGNPDYDYEGSFYKGYGSSMWHTAPEVILYPGMYTKAVDVWSVGCIFAEMLSNEPIFTGSNHFDQLDRIFSVLGSPNEEDLISVENQASRLYVESLPFKERVSWNQLYPKENQ